MKTGIVNQSGNRPIEVTTTRNAPPCRGQAMLPPRDTGAVMCQTMFGEQKPTAGLEHAPRLGQRRRDIWNAAQGEGGDHRVDAGVSNRQGFRSRLDQRDPEYLIATAAFPASVSTPWPAVAATGRGRQLT